MKTNVLQLKNLPPTQGRTTFFKYLSLLAMVLMLGMNGVKGQVTIASCGFETSGDTWSYTNTGGSASATNTGTPSGQRIRSGSQSYQFTNIAGVLTFADIITTGYTSVSVVVRISSISGTASNGADAADFVRLFTKLNTASFATNTEANADIAVNGDNNARWGYNVSGISTNSGTNVVVAGTGNVTNGATNAGTIYSTLTINIPNGTNTVGLRINTSSGSNEIWCIDDVTITGTASASEPILTTPTASLITTTTATLGATVTADGGASISSRGTVWGTSAAPTGNVLAEGGTSVSAFTHGRTGFTANTLYTYRGYAINTNGTGYSPDGTFTTLSLAPTIGTGSGATQTSFTANWSAPASQGAATFTYTVEADDDINFGSVNFTQSSIASGTTTANVNTGLSAGTTYYYRVRAVNAGGNSAWSSISAGIATLAATAPGAPTIGLAVAGNTSATVAFTAPASNGGSTITSYTATSNPGNITGTLTQAGSGTITVNGLTNGVAYTFTVTATNGIGTSTASAASNQITPAIIYCASTGPASQGSDYFTNFTTTGGSANINNTSTFSSNGYGNFTAQTVTQAQGGTINYSATSPGIGNGSTFSIFVDWNQDGDFTDGDENVVSLGAATQITTNPSGSFAVPVGATLGNTRMRIIIKDAVGAITSCNNALANSETEDYTFNVVTAAIPPTLTAAVGATVDGAFVVTFADDASWRAAITSITVGGTPLTAGSSLSSGQITFTPSASIPASLLQSSGSKSIVVIATGYSNATVTQSIGFGVATKLGITTQPTAPVSNGAVLATQPAVAIQDQYGNTVTSSNASITAAKSDAGTWTLGGTTAVAASSGVVTFAGLTATSTASVSNATLAFTSSGLTTSGNSSTFNIPAPDYIELTSLIPTQTQNFDGIGSSATANLPQGFGIQLGLSGTLTNATTEFASSGSPTSGGTYNWGQNGTSDRSIGFMYSGSYSNRSIVLKVRNNTGAPLGSFTLSFDYEQYRRNTATQTFKLQYSTSLTSGWVDVTNGGFSSLVTGSSSYNFTTLMSSQSISNLSYTPAVSVPNGNEVYFRWILDGSTSSNGVGIDNFSISAGVINYYHQTTGTGCTGDLHDLDCWTTGTGGTGSVATSFTIDNQVFNIINSSPSTTSVWTVSGTNSKIVIGGVSYGDRMLTITSSNPITGTIDINQSGATSNSLVISDVIVPSLGTLHSSANVTYNATGSQTVASKTYRNLTLGGSGTKTLSGNTVVTNTLTVSSGVTLDFGSNVVSGTGDIDVQSGATVITANNSGLNGSNTTSGGLSSYSTGANYTFNGGSSQVFGASLPSTVNNLTLNNGNTNMLLGVSRIINGTLTITNGKLAIGASNTLTLNGGLTCDASNSLISTPTSNIALSGVAKTVFFDAANNSLRNLAITGSNTMTLGNALNITGGTNFGVVTVGSGATLNTGSGFLTLRSTDLGTASIGTSVGTITGSVNVERFVSGSGRRWRFLSSPITSAKVSDWMTQFYVTGPCTAAPTGGLGSINDQGWHTSQANIDYPGPYNVSTNNRAVRTTSIRTYNESAAGNNTNLNAGWADVTPSSDLTPGQGFRTFVRGPIGTIGQLNGTVTSQASVTLALTGTVNQGNVTPTLTNTTQGWNLLGNPYACGYDFNAQYNAGQGITNINPTVYVYDATSNSYVSYNASSGTPSGLASGVIPSGAGFFVQANGAPTFQFREVYKTTAVNPTAVHKTDVSTVDFGIKYYKDSTESDYMVVKMFEGATLNHELFDTKKVYNENLNLSAYGTTDSVQLTASCIPFVTSETRVKLNVEATEIGTYNFDFKNMDNFQSNITVSLFDRYTNKTTDVRKNTKYTFEMGAGVNQWGNNRFELILNLDKTGVDEFSLLNKTQMLVYPNPATDVLNINISNANFKNSEIVVYNISGTEVIKTNMEANNAALNIETLSAGVYFVKVSNQNGFNKTVKFVK